MSRQAEIDFQVLFESCPGLFLVLDPNYTILAVSDAYAEAVHTPRETLVGKYFLAVFYDAENTVAITETKASLAYVVKNKKAHSMSVLRIAIKNAAGVPEEKYWNPTNKPILSPDNELQYILHSINEVTEFVALEKLQQKEITQNLASTLFAKNISDYKVAMDAEDIIAITDENGMIQYVNNNFCRISKYTEEELVGKSHTVINSGYHPDSFFENLWQAISSGRIWKGEIKNKTKDGSVFWICTTIVPFLNEKGKPHQYLAISADITQRMQSIDELTKSEEKYRAIFENALVPIFTMDVATSKIIAGNNPGVAIFGYDSVADLIQNFEPKAHYVNGGEREKNMIVLMEHGELRNIQHMKRRDGSLFWCSVFVKLDKDKKTMQTILLDVTSQIAFQEELETKVSQRTLELTESLAREKELNEIKSNFLGIASHEFRTPLGTILSSTSLLKKYTDDGHPELIAKHLDRITASVNHLNMMLNDFLTLEKLRKGYIDFEVSGFNLPDFMTQTITEIESMIKVNDQAIQYSHIGEIYVSQSAKILKNILLNLLSNASKYSDYGKEIVITSEVTEAEIKIKIQDHGIGIPFNDQKKLFTEFYRASNAKNIQGTGLGLVIVKNYIDLLDGRVSFSSKLNKGTLFSLIIPRYLPETSW